MLKNTVHQIQILNIFGNFKLRKYKITMIVLCWLTEETNNADVYWRVDDRSFRSVSAGNTNPRQQASVDRPLAGGADTSNRTLTADDFDAHARVLVPLDRVEFDESRQDRMLEVGMLDRVRVDVAFEYLRKESVAITKRRHREYRMHDQ